MLDPKPQSSHRGAQRRCILVGSMVSLSAALGLGPAAAAAGLPLAVELNKLEPDGKSCRAYIVITNAADTALPVLKLDLIFFRPDGVIERRLALDLGPVRPDKKSVKTFGLDNLPCDNIGSVLVNDVLDCRDMTGPVQDCLDRLTVSSRASVQLSK